MSIEAIWKLRQHGSQILTSIQMFPTGEGAPMKKTISPIGGTMMEHESEPEKQIRP